MSVRRAACAAIAAVLASSTAHAATAVRVMVLGVEEVDVSGKDVAKLPEVIAQYIASHPNFEVLPEIDMRLAVGATGKSQRSCLANRACLQEVGRATHSDYVLSSSVTSLPSGFVVEMSRIDVTTSAAPRSAVEKTPKRAEIPDRVRWCVDRLFTWKEGETLHAPPPPTSVSTPPIPAPTSAQQPEPELFAKPKPAAHSDKESLALVDITHGEEFTDRQVRTIEDLLLHALDATGRFKVLFRSDLETAASSAQGKHLSECVDSECRMQAAAEANVDLVAIADIGKLGSETIASLKLIAVQTASVVARAQQTVRSDDDWANAAQALARQVVSSRYGDAPPLTTTLPSAATQPTPVPAGLPMPWQRVAGWVGVAVGGAALATGVGLGLLSRNQQNEIHTSTHPGATALQLMQSSNSLAIGADVAFAGGGVLGAAGVTLVVF